MLMRDDSQKQLNESAKRGLDLFLGNICKESGMLNESSSRTLQVLKEDVKELSARKNYYAQMDNFTDSQEQHMYENMSLTFD